MESAQTDSLSEVTQTPKHRFLKRLAAILVKFVIPAILVFLAILFFRHQMATRPKAKLQKPARQARLVTVQTVQETTAPAIVQALGTVQPALEVTLNPEVTGIIVQRDPAVVPGGILPKGHLLYRIDDRDYRTVVAQRQSDLARAELALKLEAGNQTVARQEFKLLEEVIEEQDQELVLRQPQLKSAREALDASKAMLDKAQLDLERCTIRAPFDAMIQDKYADPGARVSPTHPLVHLTGTNEYWVEVVVGEDELSWIDIPSFNGATGSEVRILNPTVWGPDRFRKGRVVRLLGTLEEQGQMARLLVSVEDPLSLQLDSSQFPPLLIGSFVRVEIVGREIEACILISRDHLHDGRFVWVMNDQNRLEIRPVEILFSGKKDLFIRSGLKPGEQIVTSGVPAPVEGMPLRTESQDSNRPDRPIPAEQQPRGGTAP